MERLVLTLTVNPAIDQIFVTDRLVFDDRSYLESRTEQAGGRGINAAYVLNRFGVPTLAIAPSGGSTGERFERLVRERAIPLEVVPVAAGVRTNYAITDRHGLTVKLDERGPRLKPHEVEAIVQAVEERLDSAEWLLLCGSLPPGVPQDLYRKLIEKARARGVKTLLDTAGRPLQEGLEGAPTVVAPNQTETEELLNRALIMRTHFLEAARRLRQMGAEIAIVSLGGRGAVVAFDGGLVEVLPPRVEAVCPIGAGDALDAAFVWALMRNGGDVADAARWAVAAGTASAMLPGLNFADLAQTQKVYEETEVRWV